MYLISQRRGGGHWENMYRKEGGGRGENSCLWEGGMGGAGGLVACHEKLPLK